MNMLALSRERGPVPNEVVRLSSDDEYLRDAEGNLRLKRSIVRENVDGHEVTIHIQGSSAREVRKALEGIARKYPGKVDVEQWMSTFKIERSFREGRTQFSVRGAGSNETFRAVTKIAVSAFIDAGGAREQILPCLDFVSGQCADAQHARWFYSADVMAEREPDEVTHVVAVRGEPGMALWAYIELFRAYRFAVRLADRYSGPAVRVDYVYDLLAGATVKERCLHVDFGDLDFAQRGIDVDAVREQLAVLIRVAQRRSRERALGAAVDRAFEPARKAGLEGTVDKLMPQMWSELEPIILAMLRRRDSKEGAE
jgi:hypothetical protein